MTEKLMPVIYIAGPFRCDSKYVQGHQDSWGIQKNIMAAMEVGLEVWRAGGAALIPHANAMFFQNAADDSVWLAGDLAFLSKCDAVLMTPDWKRSSGARAEHHFAKVRRIPVFYTIDEVRAFIKSY